MFLLVLKRLRRARMKLMGKPNKAQGKRKGNSPYKKYGKQPFFYGEGYKDNHLVGGVLHRKGKPYNPRTAYERKQLQAAE